MSAEIRKVGGELCITWKRGPYFAFCISRVGIRKIKQLLTAVDLCKIQGLDTQGPDVQHSSAPALPGGGNVCASAERVKASSTEGPRGPGWS